MPVASITSLIGDHGVYAVFALMVAAALVPAASELVMLYGGAIASGAIASAHVVLFGHTISTPFWAYVTIATSGVIGNTLGALVGWAIGAYGGRPLLENHGKWLHATPERLGRAERWFDRYGTFAVFLGLCTPIIRSFIAIPAGIFRIPFVRFAILAFAGTIPWCFGLAGAGWGLGASYNRLHHDFKYVYFALAVLAVAGIAYWLWRRKRASKLAPRAPDPSL